ncbi:hypothetical protein Dimus_000812 [Dionaea muscipula]
MPTAHQPSAPLLANHMLRCSRMVNGWRRPAAHAMTARWRGAHGSLKGVSSARQGGLHDVPLLARGKEPAARAPSRPFRRSTARHGGEPVLANLVLPLTKKNGWRGLVARTHGSCPPPLKLRSSAIAVLRCSTAEELAGCQLHAIGMHGGCHGHAWPCMVMQGWLSIGWASGTFVVNREVSVCPRHPSVCSKRVPILSTWHAVRCPCGGYFSVYNMHS